MKTLMFVVIGFGGLVLATLGALANPQESFFATFIMLFGMLLTTGAPCAWFVWNLLDSQSHIDQLIVENSTRRQ